LMLTQMVIPDCTGMKRYWQFILPCDKRESGGMANLPALPHFFYFNLGVLAAVGVKHFADYLDRAITQLPGVSRPNLDFRGLALGVFVFNCFLAVLAYPLYDSWWLNFGNIAAKTKWGEILRGWSRGPSPIWLVSNLWAIFTLLLFSLALAFVAKYSMPWLQYLTRELEHTGANVLIYLVVSDCLLAGLYRGTEFPLTAVGGGVATVCIMLAIRFVHYLGHSGRK